MAEELKTFQFDGGVGLTLEVTVRYNEDNCSIVYESCDLDTANALSLLSLGLTDAQHHYVGNTMAVEPCEGDSGCRKRLTVTIKIKRYIRAFWLVPIKIKTHRKVVEIGTECMPQCCPKKEEMPAMRRRGAERAPAKLQVALRDEPIVTDGVAAASGS